MNERQKRRLRRKRFHRRKLPKAIRRAVWVNYIGKKWSGECFVEWCKTEIDVMGHWHCAHNIPRSKGGSDKISNLRPVCASCNLGMGNRMTIDEWAERFVD